jgi:hypothetical protein
MYYIRQQHQTQTPNIVFEFNLGGIQKLNAWLTHSQYSVISKIEVNV